MACTKIDDFIQFGIIRTLPDNSTFGIIDGYTDIANSQTRPYLFEVNSNNFVVGDKVYFFYCDKSLVSTLTKNSNQASEFIAFNVHNFGNNTLPRHNYSVDRATSAARTIADNNGDGTITDLPPLSIVPGTNAHYMINDCSQLCLVEEYQGIATWDRISHFKISDIQSLELREKSGDSTLKWKNS